MVNFKLEDLQKLAILHRVVPIIQTVPLNNETPLSVFEKLAADLTGSFLLESAEQGIWSRYSFVGVRNRGNLIQSASGSVDWVSETNASPLPSENQELAKHALDAVAQIQSAWHSATHADLPPLTSGLVGVLGWDLIREIEKLGPAPKADYPAPIMALAMFRDLVVVDHHEQKLLLVSNIFVEENIDLDNAYVESLKFIDQMLSDLKKPSAVHEGTFDLTGDLQPRNRTLKSDFIESIEKAKHYVRIGDVFQVVLSQRFDIDCDASALEVYRALRELNPSPYMYLLNFVDESGAYAVVGSSPEALVKVIDRKAITHPIAGSRPRGKTDAQDAEHAESLLLDHKEKAEHLMLVDLARNDLLKVCEPSSVSVTEFMQIHRYSHIMHLVSTVEGELREGQNPVDVFRATFPAGTLSGAPKPRALEIIDELEQSNRGVYGGVIGYFDFAGNADLAIAIRTAFIRDGVAHVQAGAGLVLDSVPETEYQETLSKAGAPLRAVVAANSLRSKN
jgi:anthranilate synthase component 1